MIRCHDEGVSRDEMVEALNVGLVVGGSIVIPHLRRAMDRLLEVEQRSRNESESAAGENGQV